MEVINGFRFLTEKEAQKYTKEDLLALIDGDMTRGSWLYLAKDPERKIDLYKVRDWQLKWNKVKGEISEHNQKIMDKIFPNITGVKTPESKLKFIRSLAFEHRFDNLMNKLWDNNADLQYLLKLANEERRMKALKEDF